MDARRPRPDKSMIPTNCAISAVCRELVSSSHGWRPLCHACASLRCSPADMTWRVGIDVSLWRNQEWNGRRRSHPVFQPQACGGFRLSTSRQGSWRRRCAFCPRSGWHARNWNLARATRSMPTPAQHALQQIAGLPGLEIMLPVQANAVFVRCRTPGSRGPRSGLFYTFTRRGAWFMFAWTLRAAGG